MRFTVQLIICANDGRSDTTHDVAVLEKDCQRIEQLGLTLAEAKQLLTQLQQHLVARQATAFVTTRSQCEACGTPLRMKEQTTRVLRTLFGTVVLASPRLYHCRCRARKTTTFRPLSVLLTESTTPELLFLETKWASLISYGMTARVLKDFLPLDETLNATTIQNHTLAVAQHCEEELGEEQEVCVDGCPGDSGRGHQKAGEVFFLGRIGHTMGIPWTGGLPHMKFTVQLVAWTDTGQVETGQEVAGLEKESERVEHLGVTLAEAKQLLKRLQHHMVERQTTASLAARAHCRALLVK